MNIFPDKSGRVIKKLKNCCNYIIFIHHYCKETLLRGFKIAQSFLLQIRSGLLNFLRFANILGFFGNCRIIYPSVTISIVVIIGLVINCQSEEKFPFFIGFQSALLFTLCAAFYSIRKIEKFNKKGSSFLIHSSGEQIIHTAYLKYRKMSQSSYNYLFPAIFGGSISLLTPYILRINLDPNLKTYCFLALGIILSICTLGFTQYFYFIYFLMQISLKSGKIKLYNKAIPAKSDWLIDLAKMANWYSTMYFLVGLVYVVLFYVFSFSELFGNVYFTTSRPQILYFLWCIIIVIIIIGFPTTTILGLYALRNTTVKIKLHQEATLRKQRELLPEMSLQATIDSLLILLDGTPSIPLKPLLGYLCSFFISIINFIASLQAVILLLPD